MKKVFLQKMQELFHALPDALVVADDEGNYQYVNPLATELFGLSQDDLLGLHVSDFMQVKFDFPQFWSNFRHHGSLLGQCRIFRPDGSIRWVEYNATANFLPHLHVAILRDIGDRPSPETTATPRTTKQQEAALQEAGRERLFNRVTQNIRRSLHLGQVLTTAVQDIRALLQTDRALVYQFDSNWGGDIIAESVAAPWLAVLDSSLRDPCFEGDLVEAYRHGKINQLDSLHTIERPACYVALLESFQIQANLAVPITVENNLWGLLCLNHCAAPHPWQPWEIEITQRLADQLAIAIHQADLHSRVHQLNLDLDQQIQARTAELHQALTFETSLKSITDQVRDSLDEQQILQTAVQELGRVLPVNGCDIAIYSANYSTATICYEYVPKMPSALGQSVQLAAHPELYHQIFQGYSQQLCFRTLDPSMMVREITRNTAILVQPIHEDRNVLGDIWLFRSQDQSFNELEIRLVQQVANQCGIAIRQARLYQAAQAQVTELERLNRLKDDFLSTVSHELRSPMTSIKMATDLLEIQLSRRQLLSADAADPGTQSLNRYFQILKTEGQREINLINNLLDLSRLDAEEQSLSLTTFELQATLPSFIEPFAKRTQDQQQTLEVHLPTNLPAITTDLGYLQRVLMELLNNACKFTPPHETIRLEAQALGAGLELRVCNSGVEIPDSERSRVFDRFYRIPNNDPWQHGGTGLGLALVKKLIDCLGGIIWLESSAGLTQFVIQLPTKPPYLPGTSAVSPVDES